jgi:hypothetical protein
LVKEILVADGITKRNIPRTLIPVVKKGSGRSKKDTICSSITGGRVGGLCSLARCLDTGIGGEASLIVDFPTHAQRGLKGEGGLCFDCSKRGIHLTLDLIGCLK